AAASARERLLDPQHREPEPDLQARAVDDGKRRGVLLAAGPDRAVDDAESRHLGYARQADDVCEDGAAGAGGRVAAAAVVRRRAWQKRKSQISESGACLAEARKREGGP